VFARHLKLHNSQTSTGEGLTDFEFEIHLKLHNSQTEAIPASVK